MTARFLERAALAAAVVCLCGAWLLRDRDPPAEVGSSPAPLARLALDPPAPAERLAALPEEPALYPPLEPLVAQTPSTDYLPRALASSLGRAAAQQPPEPPARATRARARITAVAPVGAPAPHVAQAPQRISAPLHVPADDPFADGTYVEAELERLPEIEVASDDLPSLDAQFADPFLAAPSPGAGDQPEGDFPDPLASGPQLSAPPALLPPTPALDAPPRRPAALDEALWQAAPASIRPAGMEQVALQARARVQRGLQLGERGAILSARDEFIAALRLVAEARDGAMGNSARSVSLAQGLRALEEADEFLVAGESGGTAVDLLLIASTHETPVLHSATVAPARLAVLQQYYGYAQERLAASVAGEPAGSLALFALGKLFHVIGEQPRPILPAGEAKAMVAYQAALQVDPANPLAANELAILLARNGQVQVARALLQRSVALAGHPAMWQNLAKVHRLLGETELAQLAEREAERGRGRHREGDALAPGTGVEWLGPEAFAQTQRPSPELRRSAADRQATTPAAEERAAASRPGFWPFQR